MAETMVGSLRYPESRRQVEYALMTEPQLGQTYLELLEAARWCERNDVGVFARADHYLASKGTPHATDAFATMAGLARETSHVQLCVLATPITFRHPAVILKNAVTVDEMSGGRLRLGVGAGWMELEHDALGMELWPIQERFDRLEETLGYLQAALGDGAGGFAGRHYRLAAVDLRPKAAGSLPIVVGGGGPRRTPELAGRYADEYNIFISPPAKIANRVSTMRRAAREAGRDPEAIEISVMGPTLVGEDDRSYAARLAARAAARGRTPEEMEARYGDSGIPIGPPGQAREAVAALEEVGVTRYYLQQLPPVDYQELEEALVALS